MRRSPVTLVAAVLAMLTLVGVLNIRGTVTNPVPNPAAAGPTAQSSALYCTGLTNARGELRGVVTFVNTTGATRHVIVHAVATNAAAAVATAFTLGPYQRQVVTPTNLVRGDTYALAAQIDGGGVSASEVVTRNGTQAPCTSAGVTTWDASGFDTTVGSHATLSVYNPTATAAVFNVTAFSVLGYQSPASLQGVSVGAHAVSTIDLGGEIVNTSNVGVQLNVLRGSLVVVGDQVSGTTSSFNYGTALASTGTFALVTTAYKALAQVRVANPGPSPATVTLRVAVGKFDVAPQSTVVAPYHSAVISITPNTAIPAAGEAKVELSADQSVVATLATGTKKGLTFFPLGTPLARAVLADVTGAGFAQAAVSNASGATVDLGWSLVHHNAVVATGVATLGVRGTLSLGQLVGGRARLQGATLVLTSATPALVVSAILPTSPAGVTLTGALNGG